MVGPVGIDDREFRGGWRAVLGGEKLRHKGAVRRVEGRTLERPLGGLRRRDISGWSGGSDIAGGAFARRTGGIVVLHQFGIHGIHNAGDQLAASFGDHVLIAGSKPGNVDLRHRHPRSVDTNQPQRLFRGVGALVKLFPVVAHGEGHDRPGGSILAPVGREYILRMRHDPFVGGVGKHRRHGAVPLLRPRLGPTERDRVAPQHGDPFVAVEQPLLAKLGRQSR